MKRTWFVLLLVLISVLMSCKYRIPKPPITDKDLRDRYLMMKEWQTNFEEAQSIARLTNRHILMNFSGSDWCMPCMRLHKDMDEHNGFLSFSQRYVVLLKVDFPRLRKNRLSKKQLAHNEMLAAEFNKEGQFPYTILMDEEGKPIKTWAGYEKGELDEMMDSIRETIEGN